MKQSILFPFVILLLTCTIACNEGEDGDPDEGVGTATFTVSGATSAEFTFNEEVLFTYSVSSVSGGEISTLGVTIGNIPTTPSALSITILEAGNSTGFEEKTYTFEELSDETSFGFISTYVSEDKSYVINPDAAVVNKITFTKISNDKVEGSFEVNLEDFTGDGGKIKITGTFEAVGEAFFL